MDRKSQTDDSFAGWVQPHLAVLSAVGHRLVPAHDVDDVLQETLVRAWKRYQTFDPARGTPRAWLIAIMLDRARRHRTRQRQDVWGPETSTVPHRWTADLIDLDRAITTLADRQRQVIVLHYLADLPVAEIADLLRISPGTVKSNLHDARARLRTRLGDLDGVAP